LGGQERSGGGPIFHPFCDVEPPSTIRNLPPTRAALSLIKNEKRNADDCVYLGGQRVHRRRPSSNKQLEMGGEEEEKVEQEEEELMWQPPKEKHFFHEAVDLRQKNRRRRGAGTTLDENERVRQQNKKKKKKLLLSAVSRALGKAAVAPSASYGAHRFLFHSATQNLSAIMILLLIVVASFVASIQGKNPFVYMRKLN
jgi:hypothetical protein